MPLLLLCILLFLGSAILTGLFRWIALRIQLIAVPVSRSAHSRPVPVAGGVSIVTLILLVVTYSYFTDRIPANEFAALMAGLVIAFIGIVDDIKQLDVRWRIPAQFLVSIYVVYCLGDVPAIDFGLFSLPESIVLNVMAVFALVWLLNLYNFMDGIDGIAATQLIAVNLVSLVIVINSDAVLNAAICELCCCRRRVSTLELGASQDFYGRCG